MSRELKPLTYDAFGERIRAAFDKYDDKIVRSTYREYLQYFSRDSSTALTYTAIIYGVRLIGKLAEDFHKKVADEATNIKKETKTRTHSGK